MRFQYLTSSAHDGSGALDLYSLGAPVISSHSVPKPGYITHTSPLVYISPASQIILHSTSSEAQLLDSVLLFLTFFFLPSHSLLYRYVDLLVKMLFSTLSSFLTVVSLATTATCSPYAGWFKPTCLTQASATKIVNQYATLLTNPGGPNFNQTANTLLSDDFAVYSDSINILAQRPVRHRHPASQRLCSI